MTLGKFIRDQFKHRFDAGPFGRSLTIAHGLEDLCDVKAPEKKVKKKAGKKNGGDQIELEQDCECTPLRKQV